jgi:Flp pilus assembly protein TadG
MRGTTRLPAVRRLLGRGTKALARNKRGATIIEFAIVAAPFVALILATIQTSLVFFAQQTLETTAEKTARQLVTDQAQNAGMTQAQFKAAACANLPSFMSCSNLMIDVQTADSFADADTSTPVLTYDKNNNITNSWKFDAGSPGSIIVMRTMYLFPVIPVPLGFNLASAGNGKDLLIATSVFKSEAYVQQ